MSARCVHFRIVRCWMEKQTADIKCQTKIGASCEFNCFIFVHCISYIDIITLRELFFYFFTKGEHLPHDFCFELSFRRDLLIKLRSMQRSNHKSIINLWKHLSMEFRLDCYIHFDIRVCFLFGNIFLPFLFWY